MFNFCSMKKKRFGGKSEKVYLQTCLTSRHRLAVGTVNMISYIYIYIQVCRADVNHLGGEAAMVSETGDRWDLST